MNIKILVMENKVSKYNNVKLCYAWWIMRTEIKIFIFLDFCLPCMPCMRASSWTRRMSSTPPSRCTTRRRASWWRAVPWARACPRWPGRSSLPASSGETAPPTVSLELSTSEKLPDISTPPPSPSTRRNTSCGWCSEMAWGSKCGKSSRTDSTFLKFANIMDQQKETAVYLI